MTDGYYSSKKTDDICEDVCGQVLFYFLSIFFFFFKFSLWGPFGFDLLFCRLWKKLI